MPQDILGNFALQLQGLMHVRNPVNQKALGASEIHLGLGGNVDRAKTGWVPLDPATGQARTADRPALTAFYPAIDPNPAVAAYAANVGVYPFAELGVLTFQADGKVDGVLRVNVSGFTGGNEKAGVSGGYRFDDATGVSGVISLQFIATADRPHIDNHVWDYFFVRVSPNEFLVMTGDRLPRPAAAAGTLRKVAATAQ